MYYMQNNHSEIAQDITNHQGITNHLWDMNIVRKSPIDLTNHQKHQRKPIKNTIARSWSADLLSGNFPGNVLAWQVLVLFLY